VSEKEKRNYLAIGGEARLLKRVYDKEEDGAGTGEPT